MSPLEIFKLDPFTEYFPNFLAVLEEIVKKVFNSNLYLCLDNDFLFISFDEKIAETRIIIVN